MKLKITELPAIGERLAGGFYVGLTGPAHDRAAIILAPRDRGQFVAIWDEKHEFVPAALSHVDSAANTAAMVAAGSGIAAKVRALDIDQYIDWQIPAIAVLRVIRGTLAAAPPDAPGLPPDERMDHGWYWSSTQYEHEENSEAYAWCENMASGHCNMGVKQSSLWLVRAVRFEAVE